MFSDYAIEVVIALFLLIGAWIVQGIPVLPNQGGSVTGVLRTNVGTPAVGVRVSALAKPEQVTELAESSSLAAIAETDASGRFLLENITPGRYYIVAGRIDVPTYYPGGVTAKDGTAILVTAGGTVSGIDFVLNNVSVGRAVTGATAPSWVIPIQTRVEGSDKIPLFEAGLFLTLRLTRTNSPAIEAALSAPSVVVPDTEYRATLEGLPEGYTLKSFTFGATDLRVSPLQVVAPGAAPQPLAASIPVSQVLSVVLQRARVQRVGARVSGRIPGDAKRSIYISGIPGTIYADGTFEFLGVPPGRHAIVTMDNPARNSPLAANLIVGAQDLLNLELEETPIVPQLTDAAGPAPAGDLPPGTRIPLAAIRGRVVDGMTGLPLDAGKVVINNNHAVTISLEAEGRFEVRQLLPGTYVLEIAAYGVGIVSRSVMLGDRDAELDVRITQDP